MFKENDLVPILSFERTEKRGVALIESTESNWGGFGLWPMGPMRKRMSRKASKFLTG